MLIDKSEISVSVTCFSLRLLVSRKPELTRDVESSYSSVHLDFERVCVISTNMAEGTSTCAGAQLSICFSFMCGHCFIASFLFSLLPFFVRSTSLDGI